jgi:hypothetical protein
MKKENILKITGIIGALVAFSIYYFFATKEYSYGLDYNKQRVEQEIPIVESYFSFDISSYTWRNTSSKKKVHRSKLINVDKIKHRGEILTEVDYFSNPYQKSLFSIIRVTFLDPPYVLNRSVYYKNKAPAPRIEITKQEALDSIESWLLLEKDAL